MRAVNLLPKEVRRGAIAAGEAVRSYAVLGGLAVVLVAVLAVVFSSNQVSDRKTEVAKLEVAQQEAKTKADALQSFASFRSMEELRTATVSSLAESRFDWERVMREMSLVMPKDIWLVKLTGTASPDVGLEEGAGIASRGGVAGPALEIVGCGPGQESVARLVAALEDVDGVTRVGVQSSKLPEVVSGGVEGAAGSGTGASEECRTRDFIAKFELVVAFDAAPIPAAASATAPVPGAPAPVAPNSTEDQTAKAPKAADVLPGG